MVETIITSATASDYAAFAELVREYVEWCRARYSHDKWFVDAAFSHQSLDAELQTLPISYGPPHGKTLLAMRDGEVSGCVAFRKLSANICEMKRLYVREKYQGSGIGRRLCEALIATAQDDRFELMRLDTGNLLTEAIRMYSSLGFRVCRPYHDYPEDLMPYLVFMEMPLSAANQGV